MKRNWGVMRDVSIEVEEQAGSARKGNRADVRHCDRTRQSCRDDVGWAAEQFTSSVLVGVGRSLSCFFAMHRTSGLLSPEPTPLRAE